MKKGDWIITAWKDSKDIDIATIEKVESKVFHFKKFFRVSGKKVEDLSECRIRKGEENDVHFFDHRYKYSWRPMKNEEKLKYFPIILNA